VPESGGVCAVALAREGLNLSGDVSNFEKTDHFAVVFRRSLNHYNGFSNSRRNFH